MEKFLKVNMCELLTLSAKLSDVLRQQGKILSTAESFTGGRIASAIVSISGASEIFHEGIVSYSNMSKMQRLGVKEATLINHGAVSEQCCKEMALGLLEFGADVGVSTTGIAGPKSDNTLKPVGLCYIGVATKQSVKVYEYFLKGDREEITQTAVCFALQNTIEILNKEK